MENDQPNLFDEQPPRTAPVEFPETAEGIENARKHANQNWMRCAHDVGEALARRYPVMTSADIDIEMERKFPEVRTHEKRAMGAVVRGLMRDRIVAKTNQVIPDPRANCHNQNKRVLRSLIFKEAA